MRKCRIRGGTAYFTPSIRWDRGRFCLGTSDQIVCDCERIFSAHSSVSKTGNTQSIPPLSIPRLYEKSLAHSSCRFNQRFPSKSATIYPFQIQDAGDLSCAFSTFGKMYGFGASSLKFREQGCTLLGHILCAPLSFQ